MQQRGKMVPSLPAVLALLLLSIALRSAPASPLATLAASLQPGGWAELTTDNINPTLSHTGGNTGITTPYSDRLSWDPGSGQLFFIGGDHNSADTCPRFVSYRESTNAWQTLPNPAWFPCGGTPMHGYDHTAIDAARGKLYHRPYRDRVIRKYDIASRRWTDLPAIPDSVMGYNQVAVGVAWFPERNALLYASIENGTRGAVAEYSESARKWRRIAGDLPMGGYQNFAAYNPVHKVVIFGGGEGDSHVYKLDAAGRVTAMKNAPIAVGVMDTVITVDPVSGRYLVFDNAKHFYIYDVAADTWSLQGGETPPIFTPPAATPAVSGIVASPLSAYGIVVFVRCRVDDCQVYLYRGSSAPSVPL